MKDRNTLMIVGLWTGVIANIINSVGRIDHVPCPYIRIIIDMLYEQACIRKSRIITCKLTVLQDIIFVGIALIIDNVGLAHLCKRLHVSHRRVGIKFDGRRPSAHHLLIACVSGRRISIIVVRAIVHQVPRAHTIIITTVRRVVHIREAHAMRELMTEGTDTR